MADIDSKTGQTLGIPTPTPKAEKRPAFSAAGKPNHVEKNDRGGGWRTFLWVAPLTALIWIYAEREQIDKVEVRVPIQLISKSTDRIITVQSPIERPTTISLDIQGPRASLGELRDVLSKAPLEVFISPEVGYEGDISLAEPITKSDLFKTYAVTATAARPPVKIKVEAKVAKRVPVKMRPEDNYAGATFEPSTIAIEGPKDAIEKLAAEPNNFVVYPNMTVFASEPPGSYSKDVPIAPGWTSVEGVNLLRDTVHAKVDISKASKDIINGIPIVLQINGLVLSSDTFKVTTTPSTIASLEVVGPAEAIDSLKQRKFPAAVIIDLTLAKYDFGAVTTTKDFPIPLDATHYRMPKDVTVLNPNREITITVTRRN